MPPKRDPYGENLDIIEDGYTVCDDCGGDGGGEYCKGFSPSLDGPDYEYVECSACEGTGQVLTMEAALELGSCLNLKIQAVARTQREIGRAREGRSALTCLTRGA